MPGQAADADGRAADLAVAVEILAGGSLVDRLDDTLQFRVRHRVRYRHGGFEDGQVGLVHGARRLPGGIAAERRRQPHQHVVGRAVGGPEGAGEGLVAEGAPVGAVAGEALGVEALGIVQVRHPALEVLACQQGRAQTGVVVLADPGQGFGIADRGDAGAAVGEQVGPVVAQALFAEGVAPLQFPVVGLVAAVAAGMAGPARIGAAAGAGIALRRHAGVDVADQLLRVGGGVRVVGGGRRPVGQRRGRGRQGEQQEEQPRMFHPRQFMACYGLGGNSGICAV